MPFKDLIHPFTHKVTPIATQIHSHPEGMEGTNYTGSGVAELGSWAQDAVGSYLG